LEGLCAIPQITTNYRSTDKRVTEQQLKFVNFKFSRRNELKRDIFVDEILMEARIKILLTELE
jgi:hypothetical protein